MYADDTDLISFCKDWLESVLTQIPSEFANYNLIVNEDKTEWTTLSKSNRAWEKVRKLGALLGDREDMHRRANQGIGMYASMNRLWRQTRLVNVKLRMYMFRSCIEPCFTYACGTWGARQTDCRWYEAQHRKLLRKAMGVYFPNKISNESLHQVTNVPPLCLTVTKERWRLFGQCLRLDRKAPAQLAMEWHGPICEASRESQPWPSRDVPPLQPPPRVETH